VETPDKHKDPVVFAEEVLGMKLFDFQKTLLRKVHEERKEFTEIFVCFPYRHGITTRDQVIKEFYKTR
jgi:hypothetical protein